MLRASHANPICSCFNVHTAGQDVLNAIGPVGQRVWHSLRRESLCISWSFSCSTTRSTLHPGRVLFMAPVVRLLCTYCTHLSRLTSGYRNHRFIMSWLLGAQPMGTAWAAVEEGCAGPSKFQASVRLCRKLQGLVMPSTAAKWFFMSWETWLSQTNMNRA